jgi:tripartite-type tricarboxylate transporter receptor subunit TctC
MTRTVSRTAWIAVALLAGSADLAAAGYPERPIRLVVPFAPGSATDTSARIYAAELSVVLGQQLVADNRAGAGGAIGMQMLAQATPDGYTIGYAGAGPLSINQSVTPNLPYDVARDLQPISQAVQAPLMMASSMSLPAKSVKELIALAREKPGGLSNASAGTGTIGYLAGEYFKIMTNTRILHVPYKGGGQAAIDVIAGNVQFMFDPINGVSPHIRSGKLRGLGVTGLQRVAAFPDIPTVAEAGVPGYEVTTWGGVIAPIGVPKAIIARLSDAMQKAAKSRVVHERYAALGATPVASTPVQFTELIRSETAKWANVIKRSQAAGH